MKILVFDVETPNRKNDRICSIGLSLVEDATVLWTKEFLVNPECSFDVCNTQIHGIRSKDVEDAPVFPVVWEGISGLFRENLVAAHNATFDLCVLKKTLKAYGLEGPLVYYICTMRMARKVIAGLDNHRLSTLSEYYGIELDHHNAGSDSFACAQMLCRWIRGDIDLDEYTKSYLLEDSGETSVSARTRVPAKSTKELLILSGLLEGITCDDELTDKELEQLHTWLNSHKDLRGNYPYDKIYAILSDAFEDGIIDTEEKLYILSLFKQVNNPLEKETCGCANSMEIDLHGKLFCLSGEFFYGDKKTVKARLCEFGAIPQENVTRKTDYLIVGGYGSDAWSAGNYGTKIKKALELQEKGMPIRIIQEKEIL